MTGKVLLDTNIVIALFADEASVKQQLAIVGEIFIPSIVLGELYYGARWNVTGSLHGLGSVIGGLCLPYLAGDVRGGVAGFYGSRRPGAVVTAAVGVVMGFGYRLYPSYAGFPHYYGRLRPCVPHRYSHARGATTCVSPFSSRRQVLTFRTRA